jgi:hypothetical protein
LEVSVGLLHQQVNQNLPLLGLEVVEVSDDEEAATVEVHVEQDEITVPETPQRVTPDSPPYFPACSPSHFPDDGTLILIEDVRPVFILQEGILEPEGEPVVDGNMVVADPGAFLVAWVAAAEEHEMVVLGEEGKLFEEWMTRPM